MEPLRVLVFGSVGVGKTSLCNELSGSRMPVGDGAVGVTFRATDISPFQLEDKREVFLTDTVGLNESEKGKVPSEVAVAQLIELIKRSREGYNLLIHVKRVGRITATDWKNYEFFVKVLLKDRIPCLLVVTGCEITDPLSLWVQENEDAFKQQGFDYKKIVATCFGKGGRFESVFSPLREESCKSVSEAIAQHVVSDPVVYADEESFVDTLMRAWNWLCQWLDHPEMQVIVDRGIYEFLISINVHEDAAKRLANGVRSFLAAARGNDTQKASKSGVGHGK